jgi:hypothetical protein
MLAFLRKRRELLLYAAVYPLALLVLNTLIVAKEFKVDYTGYLESNEGTFVALARNIAAHPFDMLWWPQWDFGIPFQNTYIPGLHIVVGAFSALTGHSAGLSFHQVVAVFFALGPVALYFMAWIMTRQPGTAWFAALAYSLFSPSSWLMRLVREDMNGPWNLRRLHIFAYYGEGPHTSCLFFAPLAILFLYLSVTRESAWPRIAAGMCLGLAVCMNAFAATILGIAVLAIIAVAPGKSRVRDAAILILIAGLAYLWISPLLPPSVASDIRRNSSHEYPFNGVSWMALGNLVTLYYLVWRWTRNSVDAAVRVFFLFTLMTGAIVLSGYYANANIVPQPLRYGTTFDIGLCLSAVFGGAALLRRYAHSWMRPVAIILILFAAVQGRHQVRYARGLIRGGDMEAATVYHLAKWTDEHIKGQRVWVAGPDSFHFNAFFDTPQFHGGHDPMQPTDIALIGTYVLGTGDGTGVRDLDICTTWLKAFGAYAFSIAGPHDDPYYHSTKHPERFEGHFPVLWHESDTTLYAVPSRTTSLAHVVPEDALVRHMPYNGLDIDEMSRYVAAIDNPAFPDASFQWSSRHSASIQAQLQPGQAISIQERYMPGWNAVVNGHPVKVDHDGLGLMVLRPNCTDCKVTIGYNGGTQWLATCTASLVVMLLCLVAGVRAVKRGV